MERPPPRPRIVFFSAGHDEPSGIGKRSRLLTSGLAERGWDVRVVTRSPNRHRFHLSRSPNLTVLDVPGFGRHRLATVLFTLCAVAIGVVQGRRTRMYAGLKLASPAWAAAICSRVTGRPFAALATTSGPRSEASYLTAQKHLVPAGTLRGLAFRVANAAKRRLLRRATLLIAQNPAAAEELAALVPPARVAVVPSPVELIDAPPPLTGEPHVVFTGRLSADKDILGLLQAWSRVLAQVPDARLTLVGAAGPHEPLEDEVRLVVARERTLAASVGFTGWAADVSPFLAGADVFVLPSLEEGMSNALLEACAWGRVVVASDIGPNRVVLGDDYPLLFPPGDAAAVARRLVEALTEPSARAEARGRVLGRVQQFSQERVVAQLERVLLEASEAGREAVTTIDR